MSQERVTYTVTPMPSSDRYRVQVWVDGYPVEKKYYETPQEAESWAKARVRELATIVR